MKRDARNAGEGVTYVLVHRALDGSPMGIQCLFCRCVSYNMNDVVHRWCPQCNRSHLGVFQELWPDAAWVTEEDKAEAKAAMRLGGWEAVRDYWSSRQQEFLERAEYNRRRARFWRDCTVVAALATLIMAGAVYSGW